MIFRLTFSYCLFLLVNGCSLKNNKHCGYPVLDVQNLTNKNVKEIKYSYKKVKFTNEDKTAIEDYIQNQINTRDTVHIKKGTHFIAKGLNIDSNSIILFEENAILKYLPSPSKIYNILDIRNVENVQIINPQIEGDKYEHLNSVGEWGMGIGIRGSDNVIVKGAQISKCWGDGINIGKSRGVISTNIKVYNSSINDVRRNGVSITSARGVELINVSISNVNGTNPMAGIDIEPNSNNDIIDNILIKKTVTYNNNGHGLVLSLGSLIGPDNRSISLTVVDYKDYGSKRGVSIGLNRMGYKFLKNHNFVEGNVTLKNVYLFNSELHLFGTDFHNINFQVDIMKSFEFDENHSLLKTRNYYINSRTDKLISFE